MFNRTRPNSRAPPAASAGKLYKCREWETISGHHLHIDANSLIKEEKLWIRQIFATILVDRHLSAVDRLIQVRKQKKRVAS
jgi:hypothetical protein